MATFTFDEGGAFKSVFGPLQDNQVDIVDNGVTFRFVPVNPALSGSISGDPADGAVPNLTLTATQANTSFTMTVPASNGADSLFGGAGRDVVLGGRGNDDDRLHRRRRDRPADNRDLQLQLRGCGSTRHYRQAMSRLAQPNT